MNIARTFIAAAGLAVLAGCYDSYPRIALDEDATCTDHELDIERVYPGVFILLDRSRSMKMRNDVTHEEWDYWTPAVDGINSIVGALEEEVAFGLGLFPDPAMDEERPNCFAMPSASNPVRMSNADAIAGTLARAGEPFGGTPTAGSLEAVLPALGIYVPLRTASILLVTDGAPNCNWGLDPGTCECTRPDGPCEVETQCLDDVRTYSMLEELRTEHGVETYVVGLVGGAGGDWGHVMHGMAAAGGTGEAVLVDDPDDVEPVIEEFARQIVPCLFDVDPGELRDLDELLFNVGGVTWARDTARLYGWDLVEADRIRFFGEPCDTILASGATTVHGFIPCASP
jgi:hypothetical protein